MALKDPEAIAEIVAALRHVYGDEAARNMLSEGMTLATLIDTMFSVPIPHRDAVRSIARALDDFAISPAIGPVSHLKYLYDSPTSLHVIDMEIATPDGTLASADVWLRLLD